MIDRRTLVAVSERRGYWASQLRARLADRPVIWRETRGTSDLLEAVRGWPCPIVVLDLGPRPGEGLERLLRLSLAAPDALVLVLDPDHRSDLRDLALANGATSVWLGFASPPRVAELVDRWLILAGHRASQAGAAALPEPAPDPRDPMALLGL